MTPALIAEYEPQKQGLDLAYWAWTIIANVSEGDWLQQTDEWREAAIKWRGAFHAALAGEQIDGLACGEGDG